MDLLYKPDWEKVKERYKAWWNHEIVDRCCISVTAPKGGVLKGNPPTRNNIEDLWTDFSYFHEINEYHHKHTFFGGEALPGWRPGKYPFTNSMAAFLGAPVDISERTGWVYPIIEKGELTDYNYSDLKIIPDNKWRLLEESVHHFAVEDSKGKCLPKLFAFASSGDTLAALRGTENLLLDLIDCPDYVRDFDQYLVKMYLGLFNSYYKIVGEASEGTCDWLNMWAPGKMYTIQNDFAYMLSPKMYNDIFLPSITMKTEFFDYAMYHVDGVGNFAHIDSLCELPRLQARQGYPGAGKGSALNYMNYLKKVQAAGKNLWIVLQPDEIETALHELSAKGLYIYTECSSEEEAEYLLKNIVKWTKE